MKKYVIVIKFKNATESHLIHFDNKEKTVECYNNMLESFKAKDLNIFRDDDIPFLAVDMSSVALITWREE